MTPGSPTPYTPTPDSLPPMTPALLSEWAHNPIPEPVFQPTSAAAVGPTLDLTSVSPVLTLNAPSTTSPSLPARTTDGRPTAEAKVAAPAPSAAASRARRDRGDDVSTATARPLFE